MVKALFAGVAGLGALIAVFQMQGDGRSGADAGASVAQDAASSPQPIADRGGPDGAIASPPVADAGSALREPGPAPEAGIPVFASPDGGPVYVGDVPGRLRSEASAAPGAGGRADGGAQAASGDQGEEVRRLRERVARLEQELARTRSATQTTQTQELDRLNQQVAELRHQLAQEQARRQAEEAGAQQQKSREQEASSALAAAQQRLATGDGRALEGLDSSAGSLPPGAQGAVNKARTAAHNGDLAMARYWLSVAQAEEQKRLSSASTGAR
jgi:hypothetical protein